MRTHVHATGTPSVAARGGTRKGTTGGRKGAGEATSFSTPICFATWNCCGLSNVTMSRCKDLGFDILALTETHGWCADTSAIYSDDPPANAIKDDGKNHRG